MALTFNLDFKIIYKSKVESTVVVLFIVAFYAYSRLGKVKEWLKGVPQG